MMNVIGTGLAGMQQSQQSIQSAASDVAALANVGGTGGVRPTQDVGIEGVVEPLFRMQQSQQVFDASAKVVEVGSQNIGTLLNTRA